MWTEELNGGVITEAAGVLTVASGTGIINNLIFTPTWMYVNLAGSFEIEVKFEAHPAISYEAAGIIIADATGANSLFFGRQYYTGQMIRRIDTESGISQGAANASLITSGYLKVVRFGDAFYCYWKQNVGDEWKERYSAASGWHTSGLLRVGLGAFNECTNVSFDWVKITNDFSSNSASASLSVSPSASISLSPSASISASNSVSLSASASLPSASASASAPLYGRWIGGMWPSITLLGLPTVSHSPSTGSGGSFSGSVSPSNSGSNSNSGSVSLSNSNSGSTI
jgi:hypothetical protein